MIKCHLALIGAWLLWEGWICTVYKYEYINICKPIEYYHTNDNNNNNDNENMNKII